MDDALILTLFRERQTAALAEVESKYGSLCLRTADHILRNREDAEECVNDTWLHAWNAIPPERPKKLSAWLSRVTRNLAISRLRENRALKRGGGELPLVLDELEECVAGSADPQHAVETRELADAVNRFLSTLKPEERDIFVARYFYTASHAELSAKTGWTVGKIKSLLHRTRLKLLNYLKEEGLC
ncbi:MAG: sigma-70 family RNA polymerase sigma factor [Firmicutes bacterium]|nr:sigma-70 family RNA polymerase sigma factor [Bacillota bacterium]